MGLEAGPEEWQTEVTVVRRVLLVVVLLCLLLAAPVSGAGTGGRAGSASDQLAREAEVVYLTNLERERFGIPPLKSVEKLHRIARQHSLDMAEHGFVGHRGSDGTTPWERCVEAGYTKLSFMSGENVAAGYPTPADVVAGWMESPPHRGNILEPGYCETGVGYAPGNGGPQDVYHHYWTQDFACGFGVNHVVIEDESPVVHWDLVHLYVYGKGWAVGMMISNEPDFARARWQPYRSRLIWSLGPVGNGRRTVYVKLLGKDGSVVTLQDSILLVYDAGRMPFRVFFPAEW